MITNERAEEIAGIRELAAWLEAHPEVPMPSLYRLLAFPQNTDAGRAGPGSAIAELRRIGSAIGVEPRQQGPHVEVTGPKFGGGVSYVAVVCNVLLHDFPEDGTKDGVERACPCCGRPNDITQGEREVGASSAVEAPTAPGDGHVYECCGKVGRISPHNAWCETGQTPVGAA